MKPNIFFTVVIHSPALGRSFPAEVPIINNGVPIPILITNKAVPPLNISPV